MARATAAQASRSPAVLGEHHPPAGGAHLVPGPPDPLQAAGHRRAAPRSAPPGRWPPCRCPAPATRSPPAPSRPRSSGDPRSPPAGPAPPSRGGRRPAPRPASSFSAWASRSAMRRLLTKIRVERWARTSSSRRGWMAVQIEARTGPCAAGPLGTSTGLPSAAMSSTGTSMRSSSCLLWPASTMVTGRWRTPPVVGLGQLGRHLLDQRWRRPPARGPRPLAPGALGASTPPRNRATSSSGRWVADRPIRCSGRPHSASSRSSDSARWAPRLLGTSAWISSTITVSTARSRSRAFEVSSRYSDSGVVMRMSAASRPNCARSPGGVSPVRTATAGIRCVDPGLRRQVGDAGDGRAQVALDVHRQRLQRRHVQHPAAVGGLRSAAAARTSAGRWREGTPPASCRCRWAPAAAWTPRRPAPARPAAGRRWARERTLEPGPGGGMEHLQRCRRGGGFARAVALLSRCAPRGSPDRHGRVLATTPPGSSRSNVVPDVATRERDPRAARELHRLACAADDRGRGQSVGDNGEDGQAARGRQRFARVNSGFYLLQLCKIINLTN